MKLPQNERIPELLSFWFDRVETKHGEARGKAVMGWFMAPPGFNEEIRAKFGALVEDAAAGRLDAWGEEPEPCLALIILLDQFSMNLHPDSARMFTQSHLALPFALRAIAKGWDRKFPTLRRSFFYLPLEHAEDRHLQKQSIELYEKLVADAGEEDREICEGFLDYAHRHAKVIERFGRYPDRNEDLGRTPTEAEQEFMDAGGPDF